MSDYITLPAKLDRLIKNLHRMGADNNLNNYECLGQQWLIGDRLTRNNRLIKNIDQGVIREGEVPRLKKNCVCDQDIKYNCIIRHITDRNVFVIGSCCYHAMTRKDSRKQLCSIQDCYNRHSNQNYTVCNEHKALLIKQQKEKCQKKTLDKLGNTKFNFGTTYRDSMIKDLPFSYVKWVESWARDAPFNRKEISNLLYYVDLKKALA